MDKNNKGYQHILVAIDLTSDSKIVIDHAIKLANALNTPLSLIYVNNSNESYTYMSAPRLVIDLKTLQDRNRKEIKIKLQQIVNDTVYPLTNVLCLDGDFTEQIKIAIKELQIDLVCCGHRHDFLSKFMSTTSGLRNKIKIDLLIIPLDS